MQNSKSIHFNRLVCGTSVATRYPNINTILLYCIGVEKSVEIGKYVYINFILQNLTTLKWIIQIANAERMLRCP